MMAMDAELKIRIPRALDKALRQEAKERLTSVSELIRQIIIKELLRAGEPGFEERRHRLVKAIGGAE